MKKPTDTRLKEPKIITFMTIAIISVFGFFIILNASNTALPIIANQTMPETLKTFVKISPYILLVFVVIGAVGCFMEAKRLLQGKFKLIRVEVRKNQR